MYYFPNDFASWFRFLLVGKKGTRYILLVVKKVKFEPWNATKKFPNLTKTTQLFPNLHGRRRIPNGLKKKPGRWHKNCNNNGRSKCHNFETLAGFLRGDARFPYAFSHSQAAEARLELNSNKHFELTIAGYCVAFKNAVTIASFECRYLAKKRNNSGMKNRHYCPSHVPVQTNFWWHFCNI